MQEGLEEHWGDTLVLPPQDSWQVEFAKVSNNSANEEEVRPRKFVFAEFFAGMGGFSEAMKLVGTSLVEVRATLDGYAGEWNILAEEDYEMAKQLCGEEIDHAHFAPACRTMSMARRSDQFGTVKVLRDANRPEGYGDKDAEESNEMVKRMVAATGLPRNDAVEATTASYRCAWMGFQHLDGCKAVVVHAIRGIDSAPKN